MAMGWMTEYEWGYIGLERFLGCFSEGLARVDFGAGTGFIDPEGSGVIPARYGSSSDFVGGVAAVSEQLRHGGCG